MHADRAPGLARERAHQFDALAMLFGGAVREVHAHDVEPGLDHALKRFLVARRGAERGDDFGAAVHQSKDRSYQRLTGCRQER